MKLHVLGMAHTETTKAWEFCAFTARTRVFASMMTRAGYDVRLYSGEHNEAEVTEHVPLMTPGIQRRWFPGYDGSRVFNDFDPNWIGWRSFNTRAIAAIRHRMEPGDVLCVTMGTSNRPVAEALPELMAVETGIGYPGVWAPFRVFESYAMRHYLAAREPTDEIRWYDAVIPRAWEMADLPLGDGSGGYFLFIGRLMARKGPHIAAQAAQRLGARLLVAGQGVRSTEPGLIVCEDGTRLEGDVEYVGVVGPEERAKLMGGAIATFCPTTYLEPGGGVSIESMLCGTPAIATNWGCFTEYVRHGETGYLCSTMDDFVRAGRAAQSLDRAAIREYAVGSFGTDAIAPQFDHYFRRLAAHDWYAESSPSLSPG